MGNMIKKFICDKKNENKNTYTLLSKEVGVERSTLLKFFYSKKGSLEIADKLLKFYNAEIITKEL